MFKQLKTWFLHIFIPKRIPDSLWNKVVESTPVLHKLSIEEKTKLRKLTRIFLHKKIITTALDLERS